MVTIEQKISMFSKLLKRNLDDRFTVELEKMKKEYEEKLRRNRADVDRQADEIIKAASRKAEEEKAATLSRAKIDMKNQYMAKKEQLFSRMMVRLQDEVARFIQSGKYEDYLLSLVNRLKEAEQEDSEPADRMNIYMTQKDLARFGERIRHELSWAGKRELALQQADDAIIGGFICVHPDSSTRMDFSIRMLLEEHKPYMMQTLFQAIEAGD